jgi:transposase
LGLTPREYSSGQRRRLGGITKRGDRYLRQLLTHGLEQRRGYNKATIAMANKLGRVVWAVWHRDVPFIDVAAA